MGHKFLFFTDTHLDNWSAFSTVTDDGYNSRFILQLKVIEMILQYAKEHHCHIIFGGDLFNRRLLVPADVLHLTYELFERHSDVTVYLLVGNHDMYGSDPKRTSLSVFKGIKNVMVVDAYCQVYGQPDTTISLIPYGASIPAAPASDQFNILVAHYGIHEAKLGPANYRMESDLTVKRLKEYGYDLTMLGHIHKPQTLNDKVIVMGSAMAHSFHEVGEEKYFYVFDCDTKKLVKYPTGAPKFLVHDIMSAEDLETLDVHNQNYHRVNIHDPEITMSDVKDFSAANVVISFNTQLAHSEVQEIDEAKGRGPSEEIHDYFGTMETSLDTDRLIKEALKITEEL